MNRLFLFLMLSVLCAAPLCAQAVASYKESGNLFGTRNMTAQYDPTTPPSVPVSTLQEAWADSVENDRWIITSWCEIQNVSPTQVNVTLRWRAYDKQSGYYTNYVSTTNMVGSFADSGNTFGTPFTATFGAAINLQVLRRFRPSVAFTYGDGSPDSYDGVVIAITDIDVFSGALDIFLNFLRLDPATLPPNGTQPEWIVDFNRGVVNVSGSLGSCDMPAVEGLANGDLMVHWRDFTTDPMSAIGGRQGIFPQVPGTNPSGLAAADIYVRRYKQQYAAGFITGAKDNAVPASTMNVSNSLGVEADLDTCTNANNATFAMFTTVSAQSDDVAGLGGNTGPLTGAYGAESSDTYLRVITISGADNVTPGNAVNVSKSTGASSANPNYVDYNTSLGQVGILFFDNTATGGVGENTGLSAVQQGQSPNQTPQYDAFVRVFRNDLTHVNTVAVTQSALFEAAGDITSFGQNGWVVGWSVIATSTTTLDVRSFHARVDATGKLAGTSAQYPNQAVIPNGGVPTTLLYSLSAYPQQSVSIIFNHSIDPAGGVPQEGIPENLRTTGGPLAIAPERRSATGSGDLFITTGEPITGNPAQGQIRIASFTINDGDPINPAVPPLTVPVVVVLQNVSSNAGLSLDQMQIAPPVGFVQSGLGPALPVTLFPNGTATFNFDFAVAPASLKPGSNTFSLSVSGFIGGFPTLSSSDAAISVLGVEGTLVGVDVIAQFNPTVLTAGTSSQIEVTVAVSNGGQETLRNMEIEGAMTSGYLPADLRFKIFSPNPKTTDIPAGSIQIFRTTINTSTSLKENTADIDGYRPAVTLRGEQSSGAPGGAVRSGSVTIQSQVGIRVDPQPAASKAIPLALLNSGGPAGCAIFDDRTTGFALLAMLLAAVGLVVYRRRTA